MKIRRRTYLISREFQIKFIMTFLIISLVSSLAAVIVFNTLAMRALEAQIWSVHISAESTGDILRPLFVKVNSASIAVISALMIAGVVVIKRKTSGPLYRMAMDIRQIAEGDLSTTVSLRENDEFRDVAETLNAMTASLRSRFVAIESSYSDVSRILAGLERSDRKEALSAQDYDELSRKISDIKARLETFQI